MDLIYDELVKKGEKLIEIAERYMKKGNEMGYYALIMGTGGFLLEGRKGYGHNMRAIIDAFHSYYTKNPTVPVNKRLEETLDMIVPLCENMDSISYIYESILFEMEKEKEPSASFQINCRELLSKLGNQIVIKRTEIEKQYSSLEKWIQERNNYLEENYGLHL